MFLLGIEWGNQAQFKQLAGGTSIPDPGNSWLTCLGAG